MRCYVLVNRYLAGVHVGIQAAHAIARLSINQEFEGYREWATKHETIVCLDGGDEQKMYEHERTLTMECDVWSEQIGVFREPGLNNAMTAIAVIADANCMEAMQKIRNLRAELMPEHEIRSQLELDYPFSHNLAWFLVDKRTHRG